MPDHAIVLHHVPGRMRLRVPSAKGDANKLDQLRRVLMPLNGVRRVTANASIATMTIDYAPALFAEFPRLLTQYGTERDLLTVGGAFTVNVRSPESMTDKSIERFADNVNRKFQTLTGGAVNLKEVFPFSIILYAVLFVDKAVNASQWLSWVQFAFSSYMELHQDEPVAKVGAGVEALRAEMASMHSEGLRTLTAQIAGLENAVRALADRVARGGQEPGETKL